MYQTARQRSQIVIFSLSTFSIFALAGRYGQLVAALLLIPEYEIVMCMQFLWNCGDDHFQFIKDQFKKRSATN